MDNIIFHSGLVKEDLDVHRVFSPSQLDKWDKCKQLGAYIYREGYRPEEVERHLKLGTIIHWMIERVYEGKKIAWIIDHAKDDFPTFEDEVLVFAASGLLYRYMEYWRPKERDFKVLAIEQYLLVPWTTPGGNEVWLNGYVDLVYELNGRLYVMDHKSTGGQFWRAEQVFFDRQLIMYCFMLYLLGFVPYMGVINNIKTSVLGEGIQKKLGSDLFNRVENKLTIDFMLGYMAEVGNTIDSILAMTTYPKSLSKENCSGCLFREACTMSLTGTDPKQYLETNFNTFKKASQIKVRIKGLPSVRVA